MKTVRVFQQIISQFGMSERVEISHAEYVEAKLEAEYILHFPSDTCAARPGVKTALQVMESAHASAVVRTLALSRHTALIRAFIEQPTRFCIDPPP